MNLELTRGEVVQNPENYADIIYVWPLIELEYARGMNMLTPKLL